MANMPITPQSNDPFCLKVLQAEEKLSRARRAIKKDAHPMTFSLGRAVGELVGILGIPPKFFECGKTFRSFSPRKSPDSEYSQGCGLSVKIISSTMPKVAGEEATGR